MKTILLAIAIMLCAPSVMARSYYYDDDGYYNHRYHDNYRNYHRGGAVVVGPGGVYYNKGYKHHRKYKRCWERHGRTYCKYYYRDRRW